MEVLFAAVAVVSLLLVVAASAWSLRRQRRRIEQLERLLAGNEISRRDLAQQLLNLHRQLESAHEAEDAVDADLELRRRELDRLLAVDLDTEGGNDDSWQETQPVSVPPEGFAPTLPPQFADSH